MKNGLHDYLISNCRKWEYDSDNENDTMILTEHLKEKFPELSINMLFNIAKEWTGFDNQK